MKKYGEPLDTIYPLLDPTITDDDQRMEKHKHWFCHSSSTASILTDESF